ncbi:hypothetical protein [Nocardia sp. NPDC056100]|uniref:Rv0361 family membrane protein n=1 Tax=Nocardia sp. NPDC056100 TaxID=3345712 RepID=UPI0035E132FE
MTNEGTDATAGADNTANPVATVCRGTALRRFAVTAASTAAVLAVAGALIVSVVQRIGEPTIDAQGRIVEAAKAYVSAYNAVDETRLKAITCGYIAEELSSAGPETLGALRADVERGSATVNNFSGTVEGGNAAVTTAIITYPGDLPSRTVQFRLLNHDGVWKVCSTSTPLYPGPDSQ